jgi:hypothetical protein
MSKITIDLVKLIEQAAPQVFGSVDPLLLQQWLGHNIAVEQPVTIDLATIPIEDEVKAIAPASSGLQLRVSDVITFDDGSELRIQVLASRQEDLATEAYYGLLAAISNI